MSRITKSRGDRASETCSPWQDCNVSHWNYVAKDDVSQCIMSTLLQHWTAHPSSKHRYHYAFIRKAGHVHPNLLRSYVRGVRRALTMAANPPCTPFFLCTLLPSHPPMVGALHQLTSSFCLATKQRSRAVATLYRPTPKQF